MTRPQADLGRGAAVIFLAANSRPVGSCPGMRGLNPPWAFVTALVVSISFAVAADKKPAKPAGAAAKPKRISAPRHDPPDISFRRAPMSDAVRSVHIPLATNLHVAFDTELLRTHVAWEGGTLNLWGTPYHQGKDRFYCDFEGRVLWTMPPVFPWSVGKLPNKDLTSPPKGARFLGISTKGMSQKQLDENLAVHVAFSRERNTNQLTRSATPDAILAAQTVLLYELPLPGDRTVLVHEIISRQLGNWIIRRFEVAPCSEDLWFLAHAERDGELNKANARGSVNVIRKQDKLRILFLGMVGAKQSNLDVRFVSRTQAGSYESVIWTEVKNESVPEHKIVTGTEARVYLKIPAHSDPLAVEVMTEILPKESEDLSVINWSIVSPDIDFATSSRPQLNHRPPVAVFPGEKGFLLPAGDETYRIERFPVPKEIELGVTGMDFLPNGDLAICTWLGDVYVVEKPTGAPAAATYRRFARGLCEPGGLKVIDGDIYIVQKQELTRLRDTDGNGEADLFECITQDWGFTGNYHDFSFGPALDRDGNFHVFRIGAHGRYEVPYMGWDIVVSRDGRSVTPFCSGLRSPDGFGTYQGDLFMTENQGNWIGAGKLNHLQPGRFYGYPSSVPAPREQHDRPTNFDPPAVWFPYAKLSKSASGIETIPDDRFGPFKGQMLVGEFQNALVTRVFLEKVNGEWQGCVWPFAKGFQSGVNRLSYGPDGRLYVGGLKNAAWAAVAPKDFSLDRVSFTGKVPFEIKEVRARRDGFELTFTQPVDPAAAGKADNWDVSQYRYEYHAKYGSPEYDFDGKPDSASEVKVLAAVVSPDKLRVTLKLDGWRAGYVAAIRALDVTNADGKPLRHETCWYTLNQIPK